MAAIRKLSFKINFCDATKDWILRHIGESKTGECAIEGLEHRIGDKLSFHAHV